MLSVTTVLRHLLDVDPYGLTEPVLRTEISGANDGRPIGDSELVDAINRLETRRFIKSVRNINNDLVWSLTAEGRTEAQQRFR